MITLWLLRVDRTAGGDAHQVESALRQLLPSEDLDGVAAYRDPLARLHRLGGRALLRHALAQACGGQARSWQFRYGEHGKPELAPPFDATGLGFSISHSAGVIACAVASQRNLGVDVECLGRGVDECGIARRFFSAEEALDIEACRGTDRGRRFLVSWTLREAYVKARGDGLFHTLDGVTCSFNAGRPQLHDATPGRQAHAWGFSLWEPFAGYCIALCSERQQQAALAEPAVHGRSVTLDVSATPPRLVANDPDFTLRRFL